MTYPDALSAGNTFFRIDPILCSPERDGMDRTFHTALVAGRAELLIDYIGHKTSSFLFFSHYIMDSTLLEGSKTHFSLSIMQLLPHLFTNCFIFVQTAAIAHGYTEIIKRKQAPPVHSDRFFIFMFSSFLLTKRPPGMGGLLLCLIHGQKQDASQIYRP